MKAGLIASALVAGVLVSTGAWANADLAKENCGKCHEMDKKKKGPPYKESAAKFKGKDVEYVYKSITNPSSDHPELKSSPETTKLVIKWMLGL